MSLGDELYGLPLGEFVGARSSLAKELRGEGKRAEAGEVAKLAKPTVAAWAANQVLRTQGADARELFAAGDALAGASSATLRDAIARHRAALGTLMAAARGLLDPDGKAMSAATMEKVMQTLNAASLDPALREEAVAGRLTREHTFSGLGLRPAAADEKPAPAKRGRHLSATSREKPPKPKGPDKKKVAAAERRVEKARAELDAAQRALDDLRAE